MTHATLADLFRDAADARIRELHARRVRFVPGITPLQPLDRLREQVAPAGPRLWIKRDDLTGLALGGNKTRKLEYLVADALAQDADVLVTVGAAQSNHARQTAAAAAAAGLDSVLVLRVPPGSSRDYLGSGNLLLDRILGARVELVPEDGPESPADAYQRVLAELRESGRRPYGIPSGGSTPIGALGYLGSFAEAIAGLGRPGAPGKLDAIVVASGSAGTQAGLVAGATLLDQPVGVLGVAVSPDVEALQDHVASLALETVRLFRDDVAVPADRVRVDGRFVGEGYGIPADDTIEAIRLFAQTEGILLDPVYTGKAAAGLVSLLRDGSYGPEQDVLFVHTGGAPALFAHAERLGREFAG